jgi:hypothetical protein
VVFAEPSQSGGTSVDHCSDGKKAGVFGGVFLPAEYDTDVGNYGTDARFPSEVWQNVAVD